MTKKSKKDGKKDGIEEIDLSELEAAGFEVEVNGPNVEEVKTDTRATGQITEDLIRLAMSGKLDLRYDNEGHVIGVRTKKEPKERKERAYKYGLIAPVDLAEMNIGELESLISGLPVAETVEIPGFEGFQGIRVNGRGVDVPTQSYSLVQHAEAFKPIIEVMKTRHETSDRLFAGVTSNLKTARMYVVFPEGFSNFDPDGKEIFYGASFENSFDRSSAVRAEGFSFRQWCMNGCSHRESLGNISVRHVGGRPDLKIPEFFKTISAGIAQESELMQNAVKVDISIDDFCDWAECSFAKKEYQKITSEFTNYARHSMFDAWLAITDSKVPYASDNTRLQATRDADVILSAPEENKLHIEKIAGEFRAERIAALTATT